MHRCADGVRRVRGAGLGARDVVEVRAAASLGVLHTIDVKDQSGRYPTEAGRALISLGLWGGEVYVLDRVDTAIEHEHSGGSTSSSAEPPPRVLVFSTTSGKYVRSWDLAWEQECRFRRERLISLCVGATGVLVLSTATLALSREQGSSSGGGSSSGSSSSSSSSAACSGHHEGSCEAAATVGQAALVLRLYTHQGSPLLIVDLAPAVPAAARGALWRCESASIGPALEGHGEGADWLYVTGRRSTNAVLSAGHHGADAVHPQWDGRSCVGFVWAFAFPT